MSQNTVVLGLKKPEGTDPFLASDFAGNWQKIDDAIGQLRAGGGSGSTSTGGLTQATADGRYVRTVNGQGPDSQGNVNTRCSNPDRQLASPLLRSLVRDALSLGSSVVAISHTNPRSTSKYSWTIRFRSPAI